MSEKDRKRNETQRRTKSESIVKNKREGKKEIDRKLYRNERKQTRREIKEREGKGGR